MLELINKIKNGNVAVSDMRDNQIGIIKQNPGESIADHYVDMIVMKVYGDLLVSLSTDDTWSPTGNLSFNIELLPNGSTFKVTDNQ